MQYAGGPIYRLPNEILHNIVECIYEPYFNGLNRLFPALINKTFNEIATPYLWKSLRPQYGKDLRACLEVLARSKRLAGFVEVLGVEDDEDWPEKPTNVPTLCALLAQALPNMRRLTVLSMEWINWYTSPAVLAALCAKHTSTLQSLTINPCVDDDADLACLQEVNLREGNLRTLRLTCDELIEPRPGQDAYYAAIARLIASSAHTLTRLRISSCTDNSKALDALFRDVALFPELIHLSVHQVNMHAFPLCCSAPQLDYLRVHLDYNPFDDLEMNALVALVRRFPTLTHLTLLWDGIPEAMTRETLPALGPRLFAHMPRLAEVAVPSTWMFKSDCCDYGDGLMGQWKHADTLAVIDAWSAHCATLKHVYFELMTWKKLDDGWAEVDMDEYGGDLLADGTDSMGYFD